MQPLKALEDNPDWGMVYADVVSINETGKQIKELKYKNWQLPDLMKFNIIGQPSVVMRRSAYEQAGGISSQYHYLLDHHLWLRIAALGPIGYIPQTWASARFHAAAKNFAQADKFGEEAARIAAWMEEDERFSEKVKPMQKKVWAGAYRFGARYLSVGNRYQDAFIMYRQAWKKDPVIVLKDWKRVGVTILGKFGWDITRRKNG